MWNDRRRMILDLVKTSRFISLHYEVKITSNEEFKNTIGIPNFIHKHKQAIYSTHIKYG